MRTLADLIALHEQSQRGSTWYGGPAPDNQSQSLRAISGRVRPPLAAVSLPRVKAHERANYVPPPTLQQQIGAGVASGVRGGLQATPSMQVGQALHNYVAPIVDDVRGAAPRVRGYSPEQQITADVLAPTGLPQVATGIGHIRDSITAGRDYGRSADEAGAAMGDLAPVALGLVLGAAGGRSGLPARRAPATLPEYPVASEEFPFGFRRARNGAEEYDASQFYPVQPRPDLPRVGRPNVEDIPTDALIGTQDYVQPDFLARVNAGRNADPIEVLRNADGTYILNGHHRAAEAVARGQPTIRAAVVSPVHAPAEPFRWENDTFYLDSPQGQIRGRLWHNSIDNEDALKVDTSRTVTPGQGHGVPLYMQAVQEAQRRGLPLVSDQVVSQDAAHVYDALARRGFTVDRNPTARLLGNKWNSQDGNPVFRVSHQPVRAPAEPFPDFGELPARRGPTAASDGGHAVARLIGERDALRSQRLALENHPNPTSATDRQAEALNQQERQLTARIEQIRGPEPLAPAVDDPVTTYEPTPGVEVRIDSGGTVDFAYNGRTRPGGGNASDAQQAFRGAYQAVLDDISAHARPSYSWRPASERQAQLYRAAMRSRVPPDYTFSEGADGTMALRRTPQNAPNPTLPLGAAGLSALPDLPRRRQQNNRTTGPLRRAFSLPARGQ